ncbi:hypothetical protein [Mycolicibacterium tusciae]|uniref:hypothetical protein n=1 Tax=Mycolicibacterium tusciae TaxID=75922 RepID=UPI001056B1FA|nr:hypothetical protein [Mycolicibacterium tusciae]
MKSIVRCCAVLLLTVVGLTGCRTDEPPAPTFTNWPQSLADFRFRWAAEPGIDLVSGPAVPLRAYLESYRIAELTREIGDVYPGFERAVPQLPSDSDAPAQLLSIRPSFEGEPFGPPGPFFGNEFFHILEITPIEGGYRAYVCDGLYKIFRDGKEEDEGKYVSVVGYRARTGLGDVNGMKVWRVEFTDSPPAADAPAKVTDQSGPNPAPAGDVFGPWRITGANDAIWGSMVNRESTADERVDGAQRLSQCSDLLPHWRTERDANIRASLDTPPAAEPASPGWPEATA